MASFTEIPRICTTSSFSGTIYFGEPRCACIRCCGGRPSLSRYYVGGILQVKNACLSIKTVLVRSSNINHCTTALKYFICLIAIELDLMLKKDMIHRYNYDYLLPKNPNLYISYSDLRLEVFLCMYPLML